MGRIFFFYRYILTGACLSRVEYAYTCLLYTSIGTGEGIIGILGAISAICIGISLYSALTSSPGNTRGIIKNATEAAVSQKGIKPEDTYGHSVYVLVDPKRGNNVAYVGRSKQPQKRAQPVSYTHLDVYKRQHKSSSRSSDSHR